MININEVIKSAYNKWENREYVFEKINGEYKSITYGEFISKVLGFAHKLCDLGLKEKRILVFSENSIKYMISDLAVLAYVGTTVNINAQTKQKELEEIIERMKVDAVIYSNSKKEMIEKLQSKEIILVSMDEIDSITGEAKFDFKDKNSEECSKIVFSSGTTSNPKGVMLSLNNIFSGWEPLQKRTPFNEEDIIYLFLPLHHTYANIFNFLYSLLSGLRIYLCSSTDKMLQELQEVNPTIFCAVPLIYQKIYALGSDVYKNAFGHSIKYMYCGGAKLDSNIRREFKGNGLPLHDAYALTETSSSFSIEYTNADDYESVGTIFENIDVKILNPNEEGIGEIVVKGDNVFLGYAENSHLTNESFTADGYFITNDLGYIKENKLYLIGRKETILVGSNGENIYPNEIKNFFKNISEAILNVKCYLKEDELCAKIYVKNGFMLDVEKIIEKYNAQANKFAIIKKYDILSENEIGLK